MSKRYNVLIATFLSIIVYLIYLMMMRIYPFGEYSILKCDLYQQYVNFFCYLREILLNGKSILMSWNLGLANNFFTTFAYYLMSPLNIGVIFFECNNMDIFVEILTGIKLVLATVFAVLFFEKSYKYKHIEVIIFGLIYSYSSFVICYSFHIMWLDCIYMMPLVLLLIDRYIESGKILAFVVALSYSILVNYYMGYILVLFSGIYYWLKLYLFDLPLKRKFLSVLKFGFAVLVSVAVGMIVILPSLHQLSGKMSLETKLIDIDWEKLRLFVNTIFNNYVYMFTQKSCFTFSSTITLLLIPMYYFNKNISKKEKISFTVVVIFLLLPIISPFLNRVWHAFTIPNCFNYRYSFTLIFTLIIMAFREYENREYIEKKDFLFSAIIFIVLNIIEVVLFEFGYMEADGYTVSLKSVLLSILVYFIMFILLYFICIRQKEFFKYLLIVVVMIDLLIGAKSRTK